MMNQTEWAAFALRARTDGKLIENVIKDFYKSNLPTDGTALDGGANVGFHTMGLAERLVEGRVIAVEANLATYQTLQRNTKRFPNVTPVYAALQADVDCREVTFNCSASHPGRSGISKLWDRISPGQVEYQPSAMVPATTIDKLVREERLTCLNFIKLDLEGGEYHALKGAEQTLRDLRPLVVSEHSRHSPEINGFLMADYLDWLRSLGYTAITPDGIEVTLENPFRFWYAFLVPSEKVEQWRSRLIASLDNFKLTT